MNSHLVKYFIEELIDRTNFKKIKWDNLISYQYRSNENEFNKKLLYALESEFSDEWTKVLYGSSFYCEYMDGIILVLKQQLESGRDGSMSTAVSLWVSANSTDFFVNVDVYGEYKKRINSLIDSILVSIKGCREYLENDMDKQTERFILDVLLNNKEDQDLGN